MFLRVLRRLILLVLCLGLIVAGLAFWQYQHTLNQPLRPGSNDILSVPSGTSIREIATTLRNAHGMDSAWPLLVHSRLNGDAAKIKAGDYRITEDDTPRSLLEDMVAGRVVVFKFQLIEGKTFTDLQQSLRNTPDIIHSLDGLGPAEIAAQLNLPANPEGWFLPDTYNYTRGTSDLDLLIRMRDAMQVTLEQQWAARAPDLPLSDPYQALILASIVEKETGIASERAQVAGVFIRRLQQNMRLQTDPSVAYGRPASRSGPLTKSDLATDTPYNTYTRSGLPPTPIAMVSEAALHAALHPDAGKALYFVADGHGGHTFSETYQQHQKAVANYRKSQQSSP